MIDHQTSHQFSLDASDLCLDFANTFDGRRDPHPRENLPDYQALLAFALQSGLLDNTAAARLGEIATRRAHEAHAVHAAAVVLREALFRAGVALAGRRPPDPDDLHVIERSIATALTHGGLVPTADGFDWSWDAHAHETSLERPLWSIAYAALNLLTHEDLSRLRVCASSDCDWLFFDTSRNRSRKWCDMSTCGNRAKVARYRSREQ